MFNCITDVGSTFLIHYSDPHYIRPDDEAYLVTGLYLRFVPMTLRYNISDSDLNTGFLKLYLLYNKLKPQTKLKNAKG